MKALYGVASHNPHQISTMLEQRKKKALTYQMMGFGDTPDTDKDVVLVPTVSVFLSHRQDLEKSGVIVIIFDDPVKLEHVGCEILDVSGKPHTYEYTFKRLESDELYMLLKRKGAPTGVNDETLNLLPRMIDEVEGSITQALMTFLSNVPNTDHRVQLTKIVTKWLLSKGSKEAALKKSLTDAGCKSKALDTFMTYIKDSGKVKLAFEMVGEWRAAKKSVNFKKLEKDTGVAAFDIKYMLKVSRFTDNVQFPDMDTNEIHAARKKQKELEMDKAEHDAELEDGFAVDDDKESVSRKTNMAGEDSK
ncbi:hypothetical protein GR11A_00205 [Vibrio phage vB_VcorM_GR11A]|nr:hypothetical protein GR11A_00205 [Vibrio phage vB_VcorM_GR11A]